MIYFFVISVYTHVCLGGVNCTLPYAQIRRMYYVIKRSYSQSVIRKAFRQRNNRKYSFFGNYHASKKL